MANSLTYNPIGIILSPFKSVKGIPIQPSASKEIKGSIEIYKKYQDGLQDLQGFSHLILIYHFHLTKKSTLLVKPFLDNTQRGVFATRAPSRPNPLGLSIVKLIKIQNNILEIQDLDILNETPLLDIKPYVPDFDIKKKCKIGWLEKNIKNLPGKTDDGRFL